MTGFSLLNLTQDLFGRGSIINLSRELRFKRETLILVGLIPGPEEPELVINTYLTPMVSDLLSLWTGVTLKSPDIKVRCALMCVASDLPAGKNCVGFSV